MSTQGCRWRTLVVINHHFRKHLGVKIGNTINEYLNVLQSVQLPFAVRHEAAEERPREGEVEHG